MCSAVKLCCDGYLLVLKNIFPVIWRLLLNAVVFGIGHLGIFEWTTKIMVAPVDQQLLLKYWDYL
jgi:hypothetical protein